MKKLGRPKTEVDASKLCTIDQAVEKLHEYLVEKYQDKDIVKRLSLAKGTIYNMISAKRIERYGTAKCALVNIEELYKLVS